MLNEGDVLQKSVRRGLLDDGMRYTVLDVDDGIESGTVVVTLRDSSIEVELEEDDTPSARELSEAEAAAASGDGE